MRAVNMAFGLLAMTLTAAPSLAEKCNGTWEGANGTATQGDLAAGALTMWTSPSSVSSTDSVFNGKGYCSGYTYASGGKAAVSDSCLFMAANGDYWIAVGTIPPGVAKGHFLIHHATGQFSKHIGAKGWFDSVADDKGVRGSWGLECN